MSNILLIQVPTDASPSDWQQVQVALSEARMANPTSDIARSVQPSPVEPTEREQRQLNVLPDPIPPVVPITNAPSVADSGIVPCQACGEYNGQHKPDCMYAPQNVPTAQPPAAPFVAPEGDPTWLETFIGQNGRLPNKDEVAENYFHVLARLQGLKDLPDQYETVRRQATSAKARAAKAHKAAQNGHPATQPAAVPAIPGLPPMPAAPVVQSLPTIPAPAAVAPVAPPAPTLGDFQHVSQLTDAQRAALAHWGVGAESKLTPQRQAIVQAFLTGQATSEHLRAVKTKAGTFYDKVHAVAAKA